MTVAQLEAAPAAAGEDMEGGMARGAAREAGGGVALRDPEAAALEEFQRALGAGDQAAWAALYARYAPLVRRWLAAPSDEADALVNATFARFWRALATERAARLETLPALLRYLKLCACSARLDDGTRCAATGGDEGALLALPAPGDDPAGRAAAAEGARELWRAVVAALSDAREREVVYLSYVVGLTPRAIHAHASGRYPDVTEVYRLKRRALDRLRREPAVRALR